jgi:alkylation response protein AidB-like acyl-CoA dehydrogenase
MLKQCLSKMAFGDGKCASDAVQIFGGNGFNTDYPVEKLMRRDLSNSSGYITNSNPGFNNVLITSCWGIFVFDRFYQDFLRYSSKQ